MLFKTMTYSMIYKQLSYLILLVVALGCKQVSDLTRIEGQRLEINDSLLTSTQIDSFIAPYRAHVNTNLDSVISYAVDTYSKTDSELNTAIGNMLADLVYDQANPIFNSRTGQDIDMVMLNHGGIRSILSKGPVRIRNAYEIMPFENSIVVVRMKGEHIDSLVDYLVRSKRAHPISRLQVRVDMDYELMDAKISGKEIDLNETYYVATNDYLYYGGDRMTFFQLGDSLVVLDYKIRNAIIDYFNKTDTLRPQRDDRYIQIK